MFEMLMHLPSLRVAPVVGTAAGAGVKGLAPLEGAFPQINPASITPANTRFPIISPVRRF
jgi:hypothetical protein